MSVPSAPLKWGTFQQESFEDYFARWPDIYSIVPESVVRTWVYRHWPEFSVWGSLQPLEWNYELVEFDNESIMTISHVGDCQATLRHWGDQLLLDAQRQNTWLGRFMLAEGTFPEPIIVLRNAGRFEHPREHGQQMCEPHQIVEGHMRLAYIQAMIWHGQIEVNPLHALYVAEIPASHNEA